MAGASIAAIMVLATACSTGTSDPGADAGEPSSAQSECAKNASDFLEERGLLPETLSPELTPLSKPPTPGLTITRLYPGAVPSSGDVSQTIVDAAPLLGWTGKKVSFDGSVEDVNRKLLEAIDNSDIVELDGFPPEAVQPAIDAAKEKGVLLMLGAITNEPESYPGYGATPNGGDLFDQMGELAGYQFLAQTNCKGGVAAFGLPFDALRTVSDSMGAIIEQECEECTFSYTDIQTKDVGSPAATTAIVSKLQSDSSLNFAFFAIGDLAVGSQQALTQAGLDVEVGGALPSTANLAELEAGTNSFWVGAASEVTGLAQLDTAARVLDSGEPVVGNHVPLPIFTQDNLASVDPVPVYPTDIVEQFKKIWGVD
ncbi:sugar ABC transporter substrate-binding protein [Microbacterium trichothecenolyticum]|uniref:Periplasmic binding protein domain-containing protein n=1 Tax=Microbacterium trichothecenolyticum TaxID=69370 RepID=A0A0M2H7G6_MICTR|nr:sugar ABC transporter substrate-binding protein [Microbacterium trichothecenolyticum]KJL42335.1 hypothetical protein RS82_02351 [Microbacterium trichothecenolyticum]